MHKIFISRNLTTTSPFKKELAGMAMEIIGQSLIQFSPTPFTTLPKVDWIFFYSKNGVKYFLEMVKSSPAFSRKMVKWAVMGKGTAEALATYQIQPDFIGNGRPKATAQAFGEIAKGQKVLFPRAKNSKKSIQNLLRTQLAVNDLIVYENEVKANFTIPYCDVLVFTSPLNAKAYFQKYPLKTKQKIIAIGKTTEKTLQQLGIKNSLIAAKPSETALAKAVQAILKIENCNPMSNRYAVIDLGTNTFHLLVAEKQANQEFAELHRQRFFVKLAEEGIETIGAAPLKRGHAALKTFRTILDDLGITTIKAIGLR